MAFLPRSIASASLIDRNAVDSSKWSNTLTMRIQECARRPAICAMTKFRDLTKVFYARGRMTGGNFADVDITMRSTSSASGGRVEAMPQLGHRVGLCAANASRHWSCVLPMNDRRYMSQCCSLLWCGMAEMAGNEKNFTHCNRYCRAIRKRRRVPCELGSIARFARRCRVANPGSRSLIVRPFYAVRRSAVQPNEHRCRNVHGAIGTGDHTTTGAEGKPSIPGRQW